MPIKTSIAAKIFGLAGVLMGLTILVATSLLYQVTSLNRELHFVADREIPLGLSLSRLNEYGLRRRLSFERWYGALNSTKPNQEVLQEAKKNYEIFTKLLKDEFATANRLLDTELSDEVHRPDMLDLRALLEKIEFTYLSITSRQGELLALQEQGEHDQAESMLRLLNDPQGQVQRQRSRLEQRVGELVQQSAEGATRREGGIFWLTILVTSTAVILGLILSMSVTRGLVRPVHSLVAGLQSVEKGDLSVELPVSSSDEVGDLTTSFNYFVREMRSKEQLKKIFGRYLDPRVLDRVILQPGATDASGGRRIMTISFSDIVGFVEIGEQLTATSLVNLLNSYFTLQAEAVQTNLGVVDKFIGDSVMAFWGPPFTDEGNHAILACRSALAQLKALDLFRLQLPELTGLRKNVPVFDVRLGLGTGDVVVGNIGSENARSYTVIGDTVNFASRLEGANKFYGTRILMNESTYKEARPEIVAREIDFLLAKGKSEPERIFELLALRCEAGDTLDLLCETYAMGLAAYRTQSWDEAEAAFQKCLSLKDGDPPAQIFLERIVQLRNNPPGSDWGAIWKSTIK
jgi:class 3 adenylate cyclase